jgi:transcriptional regulator
MYIPAHFAADDLEKIAAFVHRAGTADLVTFDGTRPISTLLPVIWERPADIGAAGPSDEHKQPGVYAQPGRYGRLLGHIALNNPQWNTTITEVPALAIVHGPQAYISPSWYQSTKDHGRTVPTWNYTTVHFTGPVTFHSDADWLRDIVTRLTERYEAGRDGRWWVSDAPDKFIDGQLRAIVGVELAVERIEAKDKLSQNRDPQDRANVIVALRDEPEPEAHEIADLMAQRPC